MKLCDFGLSRTLPQSSIGKGSGDSKRLRNSILKSNISEFYSESTVKQAIVNKLLDSKNFRSSKDRNLSNHVGSRWYRAPEIALVHKQYDAASDMWSAGCVIYEILRVVQGSGKRILFPGTSSFPLSSVAKKRGKNFIESTDQM